MNRCPPPPPTPLPPPGGHTAFSSIVRCENGDSGTKQPQPPFVFRLLWRRRWGSVPPGARISIISVRINGASIAGEFKHGFSIFIEATNSNKISVVIRKQLVLTGFEVQIWVSGRGGGLWDTSGNGIWPHENIPNHKCPAPAVSKVPTLSPTPAYVTPAPPAGFSSGFRVEVGPRLRL